MLHISFVMRDIFFSTLAVISGITSSHDSKNYVLIRERGFNEPCHNKNIIIIALRFVIMSYFTVLF